MALTTSIDAEKRICATCQFWQGERMPQWTPTRNVIRLGTETWSRIYLRPL